MLWDVPKAHVCHHYIVYVAVIMYIESALAKKKNALVSYPVSSSDTQLPFVRTASVEDKHETKASDMYFFPQRDYKGVLSISRATRYCQLQPNACKKPWKGEKNLHGKKETKDAEMHSTQLGRVQVQTENKMEMERTGSGTESTDMKVERTEINVAKRFSQIEQVADVANSRECEEKMDSNTLQILHKEDMRGNDIEKVHVKKEWEFNTGKCVDASPLVIVRLVVVFTF